MSLAATRTHVVTTSSLVVAGYAVAAGYSAPLAIGAVAFAIIVAALVAPRDFVLWTVPFVLLVPPFIRIPAPGLPDLTPQRALLALGFAACLFTVQRERKIPTRLALWGGCFIAYVLLNALLHGATTQELNRGFSYTIETALPLLLVLRVARDERDVRRLIDRVIVAMTAACALALVEAARGAYLFAAHDPYFVHPLERGGHIRVQSIFPHPLVLGVAVVIVLPLVANRVVLRDRTRLHLVAGAVLVGALWFTGGRGPLIAALIGLVALAAGLRSSARLRLGVTLGFAVVAVAFSPLGLGAITHALSNPTAENGGFTISYRQQLLRESIRYANSHPFGSGPGNAANSGLLAQVGGHVSDLSTSIDNAYAKYAVELGWPGLALFLLVLIALYVETRRLLGRHEMAPALIASQVGLLVASFTVATYTWSQILLLFSTLAGVTLALLPAATDQPRRVDP